MRSNNQRSYHDGHEEGNISLFLFIQNLVTDTIPLSMARTIMMVINVNH